MTLSARTLLGGDTRINVGNRSGVFSLDGPRDEDGSVGNRPFLALWAGLFNLASITSAIPPATLLTPMYFDDLMPYSWR